MIVLAALKAIDAPGSLPFLALCVVVGLVVCFLWPRNRRLGLRWLLGVAAVYFLLSLPVVANAISGGLPASPSTESSTRRPLDTIVVLDGDNREGRIRQTTAVYAATQAREVWVVGDLWLLDPLLRAGIPWARLKHDENALTTRAQMSRIRELVDAGRLGRTCVIASRLQMPRVAALAHSEGLDVTLIPSPTDTEPPTAGFRVFVPSYTALGVSRDALYEHAALAYYRWRDWVM